MTGQTAASNVSDNAASGKAFAVRFDGFSIGSNELTQLTLGVDCDSAELAELFDERDESVKWMIQNVIAEAHMVRSLRFWTRTSRTKPSSSRRRARANASCRRS